MDLLELGTTFNKMRRYDDALLAYGESLSILRQAAADHQHIPVALNGLGYTYVLKGLPAEGEPLLREALQIRQAVLGDQAWRTGVSKSTLGECLLHQDRFAEAEPLLIDGYITLRDADGPTRAAISRLISFYERTNRHDEAAPYHALLLTSEY